LSKKYMQPEFKTAQEERFFELIRTYPSPHNGQPMVMQRQGDGEYAVFFQTSRGLTATSISYLFSFVTIGVFFEHVTACAEALGHGIDTDVQLPRVADMAMPDKELACGTIRVDWNEKNEDPELIGAIRFRQTSRKKYERGLSDEEKEEVKNLFDGKPQTLTYVSEKQAQEIIWLNQRAVFDDMFDDKVRGELRRWLRTSQEEKAAKKDGLSYDCMELSGASLRFALDHYKVLHWPVIARLLKGYYLRTMRDNSTVGYMTAPFTTEQQAYEAGKLVLRLWIRLSLRQEYIHPFGTIVSNTQAHGDFLKIVGIQDEMRESNYVTFIFRAGRSAAPVRSERLGMEHFLRGSE
jgi:hypothetical protein